MLSANTDSHQSEVNALQKEIETLRAEPSVVDTKTVVIPDESQEPTEAQDQQQ